MLMFGDTCQQQSDKLRHAANTRKRRLIRAYFGEGKALTSGIIHAAAIATRQASMSRSCRVEVFDTVGGRCIYLVLCRVMSHSTRPAQNSRSAHKIRVSNVSGG
jgi:hypothetical protein